MIMAAEEETVVEGEIVEEEAEGISEQDLPANSEINTPNKAISNYDLQ